MVHIHLMANLYSAFSQIDLNSSHSSIKPFQIEHQVIAAAAANVFSPFNTKDTPIKYRF